MIDLQPVMRIVKNDSKLKIKIFSILTPNRSLGYNMYNSSYYGVVSYHLLFSYRYLVRLCNLT